MQREEQQRWNEMVENHWWVRGHQLIAKELIKKFLSPNNITNAKILDIGCSGGGVTSFLRQFGSVYGFDLSFDGVWLCASKNKSTVKVVQSDATKIPFKDSSFNAVNILEVAEHVPDHNSLFADIHRVCKKDALVFVMVPAYRFLWGSHDVKYSHVRRYGSKELSSLAYNHGFKVEKLTFMHPHLLLPLLIIRMMDKFRKNDFGKRDDFLSAGPILDTLLFNSLVLENFVIKHVNFPFGTCIFAILRKK